MLLRSIKAFINGTLVLVGLAGLGVSLPVAVAAFAAIYLLLPVYMAFGERLMSGGRVERFFVRDIWGNVRKFGTHAEAMAVFQPGAREEVLCGCIIDSPTGQFGISRVAKGGEILTRVHALSEFSSPALRGFQRRNGCVTWSGSRADLEACKDCNPRTCPLKRCWPRASGGQDAKTP